MADSTTIVIFGATGDLTQRKLVPALFHLHCKQTYEPGSWGPMGADEFIARDGRRWLHGCGQHKK